MQFIQVDQDGNPTGAVQQGSIPENARVLRNGRSVFAALVEIEPPEYNRETHCLSEQVERYDRQTHTVIRSRQVIPLPPDEVERRLERSFALGDVEAALFLNLADRIRRLEGKPPLTKEQFKSWVRDVGSRAKGE